jgi:hypothetical protein
MDMQGRDRELNQEYSRRVEELERERIESIERTEPVPDPDMTGVPVDAADAPADTGTDSRLGGAVVGGALGAVAGAIVGGPAGAIVGGAVGAAGGAVVAGGESGDDSVVDIDRPDVSGDVRRLRDEDIDVRM